MNIRIEDKYVMQITMILKMFLPAGTKIYSFEAVSDKSFDKTVFDLTLGLDYNGEKLEPAILTKLSAAFEDSTIPYKFNIVDLNGALRIITDGLVKIGEC